VIDSSLVRASANLLYVIDSSLVRATVMSQAAMLRPAWELHHQRDMLSQS